MPNLRAIDEALNRIRQCAAEKPPFAEAVVEAFILVDLFRGALEFDQDSSKRGVKAGARGKSDILLHLDKRKVRIVVEVKQYGLLKVKKKHDAAIRQAAGYALKLRPSQRFAIVTDGDCWTYFVVGTKCNPHEIRKLLEFQVSQHPELARDVLKKSQKTTLHKLFRILEAIHADMTQQEFLVLMNKSLDDRVIYLVTKAQCAVNPVPSDVVEIIEYLYKGTAPLIPALMEPLPPAPQAATRRVRRRRPVRKPVPPKAGE